MLLPNERIDQLYSHQIQIIQNPHVFAFSLDAVLLANFASVKRKNTTKIVDLCAGNGAVGLFMADKTNGYFSEVEIQPKLADMATRSIVLNHLSDRYQVLNIDLAKVTEFIKKDSVDTVVCNPPYFKLTKDSQRNPNPYLAIARHEIKTNLTSVCQSASDLLKMGGKADFVYRPDRLLDLLGTLQECDLAPKRIQFVYPKANADANMVLVEAIRSGKTDGLKVLSPLIVYQNGEYTPEVKRILYGK